LLLSPAPRLAQHFDAHCQLPENLGLGYGQPPSFRNGRPSVVRSEVQSNAENWPASASI
jgi:hypothetical protein